MMIGPNVTSSAVLSTNAGESLLLSGHIPSLIGVYIKDLLVKVWFKNDDFRVTICPLSSVFITAGAVEPCTNFRFRFISKIDGGDVMTASKSGKNGLVDVMWTFLMSVTLLKFSKDCVRPKSDSKLSDLRNKLRSDTDNESLTLTA